MEYASQFYYCDLNLWGDLEAQRTRSLTLLNVGIVLASDGKDVHGTDTRGG